MGAIWKNLKTIFRHKWYVFQECRACGIVWQGITHDLSKLSPGEFMLYARYFHGGKSPIEVEKATKGFSSAWMHHKGHNKHHWEYWTDFGKSGEVIANRIPTQYVVEMVCDWIGAGKAYNPYGWNQAEPLNYYNRVRAGRHFHPETEEMVLEMLNDLKNDGPEEFHRTAKLYLERDCPHHII